MLKRYENFLKSFDKFIFAQFENHKDFIKCQKGCSYCCQDGDYPFSRLEMEYLMNGFQDLPINIKTKIRDNINKIKQTDQKIYICPFLINNECCLYERRGLTCRTHGLAYLTSTGEVKLPQCANKNLNYAKIFNITTKELMLINPVQESLRIDDIFKKAEKYDLEPGEIRRLIDWF